MKNEPRTYPLKMPAHWVPPYPAFESDFGGAIEQVSMAVVGCQFDEVDRAKAQQFIGGVVTLAQGQTGIQHHDVAACERDACGKRQLVVTCYGVDAASFSAAFSDPIFLGHWHEHSQPGLSYGVYREVFNVPLGRFETLHSGPDHLVGIAHARSRVSEPIATHGYWGSMRDRLPDAAQDDFKGAEAPLRVLEREAHRVVVQPNHNLAVIRSGQDLTRAEGEEYQHYQEAVAPVLKRGMDFLRDEGEEVCCVDCRFMRLLDAQGQATDHSFGLAYFQDLADLEHWAEHHPTHLAIFQAFLEFAPRYGPEMRSRYWHEVSVLPKTAQYAEYVNCVQGTGMLSLMDESGGF